MRGQVEEYSKQLERSNAELQQFAYVASHGLQEPLRMVTAYLGRLDKKYGGQLDDEARQYMGYATEGAARMRELVMDLRAFSQVESQGKPFSDLDMNKALTEALSNLDVQVTATHARVMVDRLPAIRGDYTQMVQLLQNIVGNAVKYHGKDPPRVHITSQDKGRECLFSVQDNGIGPEYHEQIFQMFQRLHTREEYEGTSIGLAISKNIVEHYGGRIGFESEPGKGTAFFFTIPQRRTGEQWTEDPDGLE